MSLKSAFKCLRNAGMPSSIKLTFVGTTLMMLAFIIVSLFALLKLTSIVQLPTEIRLSHSDSDELLEPPTKRNHVTGSTFQLTSSGRYVTNCNCYFGDRLGNHLFKLAAMLYIANVTERRVFLTRYADNGSVTYTFDRWFDVERSMAVVWNARDDDRDNLKSIIGSFANVSFIGRDLSFDERVYALKAQATAGSSGELANVATVRLCTGYFQSWRYLEPISGSLRRLLRPKAEVLYSIRQYFESVRPVNWTSFVRIGIHVRAGDIRTPSYFSSGYTMPTRLYFERALRHIVFNHDDPDFGRRNGTTHPRHQRLQRFQLFIASDEVPWTQQNINFKDIVTGGTWRTSDGESHEQPAIEFDVVYSVGHDAGFDLVALSMCDVVVMSTGTFGWWAAWLSGKKTIYFSNWPRPGAAQLNPLFVRSDFFPPSWIGIDGPFLTSF